MGTEYTKCGLVLVIIGEFEENQFSSDTSFRQFGKMTIFYQFVFD